jgi:CHAD domain-containing protein
MHASRSRTQKLFRKLQKLPENIISEPHAEAVHELRTTIRRIETLLAHAWGEAPRKERKLLKQLERIRKRAGRVRDVDVQIAALSSLKLESVRRDKARVMRALEKSRTRQEQKLTNTLEAELADSLPKRLTRACERLISAPPESAQHRRRGPSYVAGALEKFATLVQQQPKFNEGNLHEFRMACKRVRYEAEMGENEPNARRVIDELKRIQDAVGEWHDWVTLSDSAEKALARRPGSPLIPLLRTNTHAKFLQALDVVSAARAALLAMRPGTPARKGPSSTTPRAAEEVATHAASA